MRPSPQRLLLQWHLSFFQLSSCLICGLINSKFIKFRGPVWLANCHAIQQNGKRKYAAICCPSAGFHEFGHFRRKQAFKEDDESCRALLESQTKNIELERHFLHVSVSYKYFNYYRWVLSKEFKMSLG